MRNYTLKVIEQLHFTKSFKLNPFAGKYPTRILIVQLTIEDMIRQRAQMITLKDLKNYKVCYLGKPNLLQIQKILSRGAGDKAIYEFDRKNMIYGARYIQGMSWPKTSPSFSFYHAYVVSNGRELCSWFMQPWKPLRVDKFGVYNHFPLQPEKGLRDALITQLATYYKTPEKVVPNVGV